MIVRLKADDPSFGLFKDDLLEVKHYPLDFSKYSVVKRLSDGFDPKCNVYKSKVEIVKLGLK